MLSGLPRRVRVLTEERARGSQSRAEVPSVEGTGVQGKRKTSPIRLSVVQYPDFP